MTAPITSSGMRHNSMEPSITNAKKEYDAAFDALIADLEARAKAQEAEKAQKTAAK